MGDATLQNVHAEFSLVFLFQGKHETIQTRLKGGKKSYILVRRLIDACCQWTSFQGDGDSSSNEAL